MDFRDHVSQVTVPVHLMGGWYDMLLPNLLADSARLRAAGQDPYLTIGPWVHATTEGLADAQATWLVRLAVVPSV